MNLSCSLNTASTSLRSAVHALLCGLHRALDWKCIGQNVLNPCVYQQHCQHQIPKVLKTSTQPFTSSHDDGRMTDASAAEMPKGFAMIRFRSITLKTIECFCLSFFLSACLFSLCVSVSIPLSMSLSHTHTHTHTYATQTHTHTHTHTKCLSLPLRPRSRSLFWRQAVWLSCSPSPLLSVFLFVTAARTWQTWLHTTMFAGSPDSSGASATSPPAPDCESEGNV